MYTRGFWIIFASYGQIGSKVVWGKCGQGPLPDYLGIFSKQSWARGVFSITQPYFNCKGPILFTGLVALKMKNT